MKKFFTLAKTIPEKTGVYLYKDDKDQVLYVGKALNLKKRVTSYLASGKLGPKTRLLVSQTKKIDYILVDSEIEALLVEAELIKKLQPVFNTIAKDDKTSLYIKITNNLLPRVLTARKKETCGSQWVFGPFPSAAKVRFVLKTLRRIFPFCSCLGNRKKPCLYYHLGLCNPSPSLIDKLPGLRAKQESGVYKRNIGYLVNFLKGRKKKLIHSLTFEMKKDGAFGKFEEAAKLRDQIEALKYITQPFQSANFYLDNPNLLSDQRQEEVRSLYQVLKNSGFKIGKYPWKIEGYDISCLSGKEATGSMVSFIKGEPEKRLYRRFKVIRQGPDDTAMVAEVLKRRFGHKEWEMPDLVVIDGGKGQVGAGVAALNQVGLKIPVIGLAKRREEVVFLTGQTYQILSIPLDSPAVYLLRRLRDEAHRFARSYHHFLRRKLILEKK